MGTVTCDLAGTLTNGSMSTVTLNVTAPGSPGMITNNATASSDGDDDTANMASESTNIVPPPPMEEVQPVPALNVIGLALLTGLIGLMGAVRRRRRG